MVERTFISERVEGFLRALTGRLDPEGSQGFPDSVNDDNFRGLRCEQKEHLRDWFRRCVKEFADDKTENCSLDDYFAVFAYIRWRNGRTLSYANVNILCTECTLDEFYLDETDRTRGQYLRLDLDYNTLGPVFTHPLPHIHAIPYEPAARFALDDWNSPHVLIDFVEFAYRHLRTDEWLAWAKLVWERGFAARYAEADNPLDNIIDAFTVGNNIEDLHGYAEGIRHMRRLLRRHKDSLAEGLNPVCDLCASTEDRGLLTFSGNVV